MPLPDKLFSYEQSILSKMPILLECLEKEKLNVKELFSKTKNHFESVLEFTETMDALFALGKITMNDLEEIEYAG